VNALLTQLLPVVTSVVGSGVLLALFDRRRKASEAKKLEREGGKADAEGQVAISGQSLEWVRDYRAETKEAKFEAAEARQEAREANQRADQCARDRDNDRERIEDLERVVQSLSDRLAKYEQV
jgi:hypothetical protein